MSIAHLPQVLVEGLCKTYRDASNPALNQIDLTIAEGDFFALLGPNGAGKTTLISILCGLLAETSGRIRVRSPTGALLEPRAARAFLGLMPQELAFYPTLTVMENLRYFGAMHGLTGNALHGGLEHALAVGRLQDVTSRRADTLSGGLKRRLSLAISVVHSPRLLVLDEPTAGVDAQSRRYLGEELKRLNATGATIIYTSHHLNEVQQLCDTVAIIDKGRVIAQGKLNELLQGDAVTLGFAVPPPACLLAELGVIADVTAVQHDGHQVLLFTAAPAATLITAMATVQQYGVSVEDATMGHRDLESLFFQLTGKALRDGEDDLYVG